MIKIPLSNYEHENICKLIKKLFRAEKELAILKDENNRLYCESSLSSAYYLMEYAEWKKAIHENHVQLEIMRQVVLSHQQELLAFYMVNTEIVSEV